VAEIESGEGAEINQNRSKIGRN